MSLAGLVLFLVGLASLFLHITHRESTDSIDLQTENSHMGGGASAYKHMENLLDKLSLPICFTDSKGTIAGATSSFSDAVGKDLSDLLGATIDEILPIDRVEAVFESGTWWISQTKDGARYYFFLSPTPDGKPPAASPDSSSQAGTFIYDPATNLYTDDYRKIRGPEEVGRAQRYKRQLSGLLLSLTFEPSSDVKLTPQQSEMLSNAFKIRVQAALRTTDCGFLMRDGRIQILLPETPQAGAKTLLSRLITLPQDVFDEDIRGAVNPKVKSGMFSYNGTNRMEYGIFSAALEESFLKSKEGVADSPSNQAA
jgi:PAS domain-containing protein